MLIPIYVLVSLSTFRNLQERRDLIFQGRLETARILSIAAENVVDRQVIALDTAATLASSEAMDDPRPLIERAMRLDPSLQVVGLLDESGKATFWMPASEPRGKVEPGDDRLARAGRSEGVGGTRESAIVTDARRSGSAVGYNVIAPLRDKGRVSGYLVGFIEDSELSSALKVQIGEAGNIGVIDSSGTALLLSFKPSLTWRDRDRTFVESIMTAVRGEEAINYGFDDPIDGKRRIGASVPIASLGWAANVFEPEGEAFSEQRAIVTRDLALLAAVGILGSLVVWALAVFLVRPLQRLAAASSLIADGDLGARVQVDRRDELGQLATSFNDMAERVQQKIETEERVADLMRGILLPTREFLSTTSWLEVGLARQPAFTRFGVGGDFYDVFRLASDSVAVILGDVAGHGIDSATHAANVRYSLRSLLSQGLAPGEALQRLNDELYSRGAFDDERTAKFVTVLAAIIGEKPRRATIANAGHLYPYICGPERCAHLDVQGMLVGALPSEGIGEIEVDLDDGSSIVMITDGVLEARDQSREGVHQYGEERFLLALGKYRGSSVQDIAEGLFSEALEFANGDLTDDAAIVVVRTKS